MTCPNCGKQHENSKGMCPFCSVPARIAKRQRERPSEILGSTFECKKCGQEITKWKTVKVPYYPDDPNSPCFEDEVPDHTCPPLMGQN